MEISISTSTNFLAFSWSGDCSTGMQIIHLISDIYIYIYIYIYNVRIDGCLVVAYLERSISTLNRFFRLFFLVCKFYNLGLSIIAYLRHRQCFIWEFFSISIYKIWKYIHHLLVWTIFPDLEMAQGRWCKW